MTTCTKWIAKQHDHRVGHEVVHAAQQPAGRHLVLDVVDAFPGGLRAGAVGRPEDQAGDDLHEEANTSVLPQT